MNPVIERIKQRLPEPLSHLLDLAQSNVDSYDNEVQLAFMRIEPALWQAMNRNPLRFLEVVRTSDLLRRAEDLNYLGWTQEVAERTRQKPAGQSGQKGYLSAEFAIRQDWPIYSGGLGVLSGDHVKGCSDSRDDFHAMGLFYPEGYFEQVLKFEEQVEDYRTWEPDYLGFERHKTLIPVEIGEVTVQVSILKGRIGSANFYLLDTDIEENNPQARQICNRLYAGGKEKRIQQEMVLGIGGYRAFQELEIELDILHLNEGHAAFAAVEHLEQKLEEGLDFEAALASTKQLVRFTTHTPVPAGIDRFGRSLVEYSFSGERRVTAETIMKLGCFNGDGFEDGPDFLNMAALALNLAGKSNGVSQLHGEISRQIFAPVFPNVKPEEVPITAITNGVHAPTHTAEPMQELFREWIGKDWYNTTEEAWKAALEIPDKVVWEARLQTKSESKSRLESVLPNTLIKQNWDPQDVGWASNLFPNPNGMIVGSARRMATYKRVGLVGYEEFQRLEDHRLADPPTYWVIAGKAHPDDDEGKAIISQLARHSSKRDVRGEFVFPPNYGLDISGIIIPLSDVWVNVPRVGQEACGTSGMKAVFNGVPNLSVRDGWFYEAYRPGLSFAVDAEPSDDDAYVAQQLYRKLDEVKAIFTTRQNGVPTEWTQLIKRMWAAWGHFLSVSRMLDEYYETMYV